MTDKKPKVRLPRAITILDYLIAMQDTDNLTDEDTLETVKQSLMLKVVQEARRR